LVKRIDNIYMLYLDDIASIPIWNRHIGTNKHRLSNQVAIEVQVILINFLNFFYLGSYNSQSRLCSSHGRGTLHTQKTIIYVYM